MKFKNLNLIYFSPTGTTQKVVREIARTLSIKTINEYNISLDDGLANDLVIDTDSLTIVGAPVYSGRVSEDAIRRIQKIHSSGSPVVLVVVYGNRAFDDALVELRDVVEDAGFKTLAVAAFIGEHSYSTIEKPIAMNRPDDLDLEKAQDFAFQIDTKLKALSSLDELIAIDLPGNYPYKERGVKPVLSPETNADLCTKCKICEEVCPTNAIVVSDKVITDKSKCIWCCACVKACPENARTFDHPIIHGFEDKLFATCSDRKEPETFL